MFLTNIPAPYTIDFFELIGKKCELTVVFERSRAKDRENSWLKREYKNFKGIFYKIPNSLLISTMSFENGCFDKSSFSSIRLKISFLIC